MKIHLLSDLHLEFHHDFVPRKLEYDLVILAGDIHSPGRRAVEWACRDKTFGSEVPIILVPGNHEYYGTRLESERDEMRRLAVTTNVHVLDRDVLVLDDPSGGQVRILGCTLWTDFEVPIEELGAARSDARRALKVANEQLNDFRLIEVEHNGAGEAENSPRLLTAEETLGFHRRDREWLQGKLQERFDGRTIVVTHHGPSLGSVHHQFSGSWLTPAFVSHLPDNFFGPQVNLWVHGHTHHSFDYRRNGTRVVCNPRGNPLRRNHSQGLHFENEEFNAELILEVSKV